ncbi:amino acid ABC transporter permease [Solicola gregarius]|uniref:Amino acid ABC transporter permease n=1 Tax=Solicola gregarius TaxID=2908642 RepID=A0AA46TGT1_9ACTN|nr:amino acid ABC transporter permease [Solicola gregarius]UYM04564.1 amino acid ABC transporter permease [Solicola gregarius]
MNNVLFDAPGPKARLRQRIYTVIGALVIVGFLAWLVLRMQDYGQLDYEQYWEVFVTPTYVDIIVQGLRDTLLMAVSSIIAALAVGVVFGVGKLSEHAWIRWPCWAVVEFFRAIPVLLLMLFIYFTYGIGDGFGSYWSVVIALTLYNGAVLAEVFRAGLLAVPNGQSEAGYAIGLGKTQVTMIVLLPQAVKIMLPAIISQMVVALKDTSLGYVITAPGLTDAYRLIKIEFTNQLPAAIVIGAIYIVVNLILTWIATMVQKRIVGEKKQLEVPAVGGPGSGTAV